MIILVVLITSIVVYLVRTEEVGVGGTSTTTSQVAVVSVMRKPIDFPLWLSRLRQFGVVHFYLRIEDTPELEDFLKTQMDITFVIAESAKTNNYETIQHRQRDFVNSTIAQLIDTEKIDWIFNIDADELFEGSFAFLDTLCNKYKCVKIENIEALYKGEEQSCFSSKTFVKCNEPGGARCRAYVNGKAGGRIDLDVKQVGPHDFSYKNKYGGEETYKVPFKDLHILHFDSCTFGAWVEKFKHLSKGPKKGIPFPYYHESMTAITRAYETYRKYTRSD
jgi:hypothetical protein